MNASAIIEAFRREKINPEVQQGKRSGSSLGRPRLEFACYPRAARAMRDGRQRFS